METPAAGWSKPQLLVPEAAATRGGGHPLVSSGWPPSSSFFVVFKAGFLWELCRPGCLPQMLGIKVCAQS